MNVREGAMHDTEVSAEAIDRQVLALLDEIDTEEVIVVGMLRYGAHIPHIYARAQKLRDGQAGKKRFRLLLSHMIGFDSALYESNTFVLLDDTMYRGRSMARATSRLLGLGVDARNIKRAVVVKHASCAESVDYPPVVLQHPRYMAWKEQLAATIRDDIRPTERDHPLYYFRFSGSIGAFISAVRPFGDLHAFPVGPDSRVFRFTLTLDVSTLADLNCVAGVELSNPCKIKFYLTSTADGAFITMVPIVPTEVSLPEFFDGQGSVILADMVSPPSKQDIFGHSDRASVDYRDRLNYFLISRGIAGLLLLRFVQRLTELMPTDLILRCISAEIVDENVKYEFPESYLLMHDALFSGLDAITQRTTSIPASTCAFGAPRRGVVPELLLDPLVPDTLALLELVTRRAQAATWDPTTEMWDPAFNPDQLGVTHSELLAEYRDPYFVSVALDDLLDAGLLRAKDACARDGRMARYFLPGGEYKAIEVERLGALCRTPRSARVQRLAGEGRFGLPDAR
jgi:hypothetical protein